MDPRVISLDIETYGLCHKSWSGKDLPDQNHFHPRKSLVLDGVSLADLILTVSVTIPKEDPRCVNTGEPLPFEADRTTAYGGVWTAHTLAAMVPGETMVFEMHRPQHRKMLARWIKHADTIIGMNLPFDVQYLRMLPEYRGILGDATHFLIDLGVVNYIQCEQRPERSLKDLGPVLGTHVYKGLTGKTEKWDAPDAKDKYGRTPSDYNAEDTHNTMLAIAHLARRVLDEWAGTDKLSPFCLNHYNDVLWGVIRKATFGIPMHTGQLRELECLLERKCGIIRQLLASRFGLHVDNTIIGAGCQKTQQEFMEAAVQAVDEHLYSSVSSTSSPLGPSSSFVLDGFHLSSIKEHPLFSITPKKGEISFSDQNRYLLRDNLPDGSLKTAINMADRYAKMQKLLSSYIYPLLRHKRVVKTKVDRGSVLIHPNSNKPYTPETRSNDDYQPALGRGSDRRRVGVAHPSWYIVPGRFSEYSDQEGGQLQARPSAKNPAAQTFPYIIKQKVVSRYGEEGEIFSYDLSQIELRTAGLRSGEPSILAAYDPDGYADVAGRLFGHLQRKSDGTYDLHTAKAVEVFGRECLYNPDFESAFRHPAKQSNFTDLYWGGAGKLQSILLKKSGIFVPLEVCQQIVDARARVRPVLIEWQKEWLREVQSQGYAILPFTGHSRYFMGGEKNEQNEILNFPIQCIAAVTLHEIAGQIKRRLPPLTLPQHKVKPFLNVYDAEYFDIPKTWHNELAQIVDDAVRYVETEGYWAMWQDRLGRTCPLAYDITTH